MSCHCLFLSFSQLGSGKLCFVVMAFPGQFLVQDQVIVPNVSAGSSVPLSKSLSIRRHSEMGSLWAHLLLSFIPIFLKLCRCFCYGLYKCACGFGVILPLVFFYQLFPLF